MKSLLLLTLLLGIIAATGCSQSKTEEKNDPYSAGFGQYHYFETPEIITARSGVEFEVIGWMTHELTDKEKKFRALRLLCNWPKETEEESKVYTPANLLVDGYNIGGAKSSFQHGNLGPTDEDRDAGLQPFVLTQTYMPAEWNRLEIQFQGSTSTTLEIKNI